MDIDLVYLWVDGSDPKWQEKRNALTGNTEDSTSADCKGRYADSGELKYSLRSIDKYAPWIRKIFIVTDNQIPDWLDMTNPKIEIVDHTDILPHESLPCFNSSLLEKFLHKVPHLSEHFLFSNDDTFINKPVTPETFFAADGFPLARFRRRRLRRMRWYWRVCIRRKPLHNYSLQISNTAKLVKERFGKYYNGMPHHNIDAYIKSDCRRVAEQLFRNEFETQFINRMRSPLDTHRVLYYYVALTEKRAHLRYPSKKESLQVQIDRDSHYKKLEKYKPTLFCMNDSQFATDTDRMRAAALLESYFPDKSQFEK